MEVIPFLEPLHFNSWKLIGVMQLCMGAIVFTKQWFGHPISCYGLMVDGNGELESSLCWTQAKFRKVQEWNQSLNLTCPDPTAVDCLDLGSFSNANVPGNEVHYPYLQWIWLVFFVQAGCTLLAPILIWKTCENGKIEALVGVLSRPQGFVDREDACRQKGRILSYFWYNREDHGELAFTYCLCEFLMVLNHLGQFFLMEYFLCPSYAFFPASGSCEVESGLLVNCVLSLNQLMEQFFWVNRVLLMLLTIIGFVCGIVRIMTILSPELRNGILYNRGGGLNSPDIYYGLTYGDWTFLLMVAAKMDRNNFIDLLMDLSRQIRTASAYVTEIKV